jgi:hypothetical protein
MLVGEPELRRLLNEVDHLRKQVTSLQQSNNKEVERRRAAERRAVELEEAASMACENPCDDCGGCNTAKEKMTGS